MAPPQESPLYSSGKLPTHAEMVEIIESMAIHDPYGLPDLQTIDTLIAAAATDYDEKKAEYDQAYKKWDEDPNKDPKDTFPTPDAILPELHKMCPALTFRDDSIKREVVVPSEASNRLNYSYYPYTNQENELGMIDRLGSGDLKTLITDVWPADFREKINKSCESACEVKITKIQRGSDLSYSIYTTYHSFIEKCLLLQRALLVYKLREANHIRQLGELDLRAEIKLRKKQYPNQPVLVMLGEKLEDYYMNIYDSNTLDGALLMTAPNRNHNENKRGFSAYESAVITASQVKMSHSFDFAYGLARVDRGWNIAIGLLMNLGIQIIPRLEERATADSRQQTLFAFN